MCSSSCSTGNTGLCIF
uniref:Uncharacterized protein n=1 Tax=Anguilla anguilla TaxID=7936 RepID=A0A0E9PBJ5_ANGAN